MAEEPVYNLLQAIDPTKIKVPISERFSKLTLSSNKKKKEQQEESRRLNQVRELRDSASRNLLEELSQQIEEKPVTPSTSTLQLEQPINPFLYSDSSKDQSYQHEEKRHLGEYYETTMDSLNVTEDESDLTEEFQHLDVDLLSQKVSALSVVCHPAQTSESLSDVTQLVSTESQRSSMGDIQRFHNIEEIPVKFIKREVTAITSSSSSSVSAQSEGAVPTYEISDDEDGEEILQNEKESDQQDNEEVEDEEETEDEVVTISDSSESNLAEDHRTPMSMGVSASEVLQAGEMTLNEFRNRLNLPLPTLSPDKMERVAAFLRDVSFDQRQRKENGYAEREDSICNYNLTLEEKEKLDKANKLKTAETESMTPEDEEGEKEETPEAIKERQRRLNALEEKEETKEKFLLENLGGQDQTPKNRERRLVSADTVENTIISEEEDSMSLQVTPTQKRILEDAKKGSEVKKLKEILPDLNLKTPQTLKRNENINKIANKSPDLNYFSPGRQRNIRRIESVETEPNTLIADENISPNNYQNIETQENMRSPLMRPRRIESAETEPNTIINDETLSPLKSIKTPQKPLRNLATAKIQENTLCSVRQIYSPKSPCRRGDRRLVSADTEENTMSDLQLSNSTNSLNRVDHKGGDVTPQKYKKEKNYSVPSSPVYRTPQKHILNSSSSNSIHSIISSSNGEQIDESAPESSITILETDDEKQSVNETPPDSSQPQENNKLSNSFQEVDVDSQQSSSSSMAQIQMSMANINISAKINIKITIPDSLGTTSDDEDSNDNQDEDKTSVVSPRRSKENSTNENQRPSLESITSSGQNSLKNSKIKEEEEDVVINSSNEEIVLDSEKSEAEDDKFVDTAAKLLTQLYGNAWQTPDVLRKLQKTKENEDKKQISTETPKIIKSKTKNKEEKISVAINKKQEDSVLGDFSMFRRQIVKTHGLDSTRLYTPKSKSTKINEFRTEPRKRFDNNSEFNKPQTESCRKPLRTPMARVNTQEIRKQNHKWRQLIDSDTDSECNNASDDEDADNSDDSWKGDEESIGDSDFEISPEKPKRRGNKKNTQTTKIKTEKEDNFKEEENDNNNKNKNDKKNTTNKNKNIKRNRKKSSNDDIIYLDLSKEEVEVQDDVPQSPPANHDETFASKLNEILKTCRHEDKPKLPSSAQSTKSKRKLFTPVYDHEFDEDESKMIESEVENNQEKKKEYGNENDGILIDDGLCPFDAKGKPKKLELFNKKLEAIKNGQPVFPVTPSPKKVLTPNRKAVQENKSDLTPKSKNKIDTLINKFTDRVGEKGKNLEVIRTTPQYKYSFLKSLDATVSNMFCHPDAIIFRDNYRLKKEELSGILYDLYNEKLFKNALDVPLTWNKKLLNTAGRCLNKKKLGVRSSVIELSEKVLTSADRLRCTLIHELCHAATWVFNGEGGHGRTWKEWAHRANTTFPELPKIGVCHQYEIEYKYTYKCTLCAAKSHAHSKSKKVENIRCSYCHGAIEIFLNKKDKDGNILPTPVREPTGFAKFVKDNYKKYKNDNIKHADVMKILSGEFAALKVKNDKI